MHELRRRAQEEENGPLPRAARETVGRKPLALRMCVLAQALRRHPRLRCRRWPAAAR